MEPRLATLERQFQVKTEPTSTPKIKRERDEEQDTGVFQRRRLAANVEVIDLTET